ncbi:aldo/keto reductase [Octadecabacter arcticus]|uniref:aldo/keto reductase n=1 Tax=Octadecabacter arcticus TaxID=53946 RepID=UPI0002DE04C1|nr:aldo/keto reductase [Octadecabacter arcticus]
MTGKYADGAAGRLKDDCTYAARYGQPWMHETARGLSALSDRCAIPAITLAVAWVARHSAVTSTLISARNASQLKPSLDALNLELSNEIFAEITALSPTPAPATDRSEEA